MTIQSEDMAVFLAVVREGSFGRAAHSLLVSQPSVSERIARLERDVGAPLFHRSTRGATLTPAGDAFLPYAQRTVALLDDASSAVRALDAAPRLRVAVHSTFAHRVVPLVLEALGSLRRSIKIRDAHSDSIVAMLIDGASDLGFVVPCARPRALQFTPLPSDPIVAVTAPSHPLAGKEVGFEDLADTRLAFNRFGTGADEFVRRLGIAGIPEWRWTECSDAVTALHLAAEHEHVALVTRSLAEGSIRRSGTVALRLRGLPRWSVPLTLAYRRTDREDPAVCAVTSAVRRLGRRGRSAPAVSGSA
jgi:DNA-binding transcriptional LysR family regulator